MALTTSLFTSFSQGIVLMFERIGWELSWEDWQLSWMVSISNNDIVGEIN